MHALEELQWAAKRNAKHNKSEDEWFATLDGEARFIIAQNVRIFEAVMHITENSGDQASIDALTERLKASDVKLDAATGTS